MEFKRLRCAKEDLDVAVDYYIHSRQRDLPDSFKLELLDARLKVQRVIYQLERSRISVEVAR